MQNRREYNWPIFIPRQFRCKRGSPCLRSGACAPALRRGMGRCSRCMQYNVAQLLKEPMGSTRSFRVEAGQVEDLLPATGVSGSVRMLRTHRGVLVNAGLEIASVVTCSRCVDDFDRVSTLHIEEGILPKTPDPGHRPAYRTQGRPVPGSGGSKKTRMPCGLEKTICWT